MSSIPTPNAPKTYDELVELLKNDNKVKVAGESAREQLTGMQSNSGCGKASTSMESCGANS